MPSILIRVIFILLIIKCHSIRVDYIEDDATEDSVETLNMTMDARRSGDDSTCPPQNIIKLRDRTICNVSNTGHRDPQNISKNSSHDSTLIVEYAGTDTSMDDYYAEIKTIKDYEYVYDDINITTTEKVLKLRIDAESVISEDVVTSAPNTTKEDSTKINMMDFYNLEPAISLLNLSHYNDSSKSTFQNNSVWFVPEKYPCWELPILYGELGHKKRTSDVFLNFAGNLKNVIDLQKPSISEPKSSRMSVAPGEAVNKWCTVEPCYGDHTLCLFPNKDNSKICDITYRVQAPSMLEQIAVVNTINSMRNRVATGLTDNYKHLPSGANMKQIIYDYDLEQMAMVWLKQCLPGPAPCSALDSKFVKQLECTKYAEHCCVNSYRTNRASKCIPRDECYLLPVLGCIYTWYWSAGENLHEIDVQCGHAGPLTYSTVQILWANTNKIGCAYGSRPNGDVRVVCNFAPGAPFFLDTKFYCGFIAHRDITDQLNTNDDITDLEFLSTYGINLKPLKNSDLEVVTEAKPFSKWSPNVSRIYRNWGLDSLTVIYEQGSVRQKLNDYTNGTKAMIARLVTRYSFYEDSESRCDSDEPIYVKGAPGSLCVEISRRYDALCYDFRDPTPGYRLVAVVAPVALFTLILYDLFSGVVRQTNY